MIKLSLRSSLLPKGQGVVVADDDSLIHLGLFSPGRYGDAPIVWTTFKMQARALAVTADGIILVLCNDGAIWLYSTVNRQWLCVITGTVDLIGTTISNDNRSAATFDLDGRIIWLDLDKARSLLERDETVAKEIAK